MSIWKRAFAVGGAGVEFVEGAVVVAPRVRVAPKTTSARLPRKYTVRRVVRLRSVYLGFVGGIGAEVFDGVGDPDAREVGVTTQAVAGLPHTTAGLRARFSSNSIRRTWLDTLRVTNKKAAVADEPRAGVGDI